MPPGSVVSADEGSFESAGGLRIHFRAWRPAAPPRAIIVIVPRFNSHSGYYAWVPEQLAPLGVAVYGVDVRGRGKSDGERFDVSQCAGYLGDVNGMVGLARSRTSTSRVCVRPQRRRRARVSLHRRTSGRTRRPDLRELRVPDAGSRLALGRSQRSRARLPGRPRTAPQERGFLARSDRRRDDEFTARLAARVTVGQGERK